MTFAEISLATDTVDEDNSVEQLFNSCFCEAKHEGSTKIYSFPEKILLIPAFFSLFCLSRKGKEEHTVHLTHTYSENCK